MISPGCSGGVGSRRARTSGRLVVQRAVSADDLVRHDGVPLVSPTLAVLQSAGLSTTDGIIAAGGAVER